MKTKSELSIEFLCKSHFALFRIFYVVFLCVVLSVQAHTQNINIDGTWNSTTGNIFYILYDPLHQEILVQNVRSGDFFVYSINSYLYHEYLLEYSTVPGWKHKQKIAVYDSSLIIGIDIYGNKFSWIKYATNFSSTPNWSGGWNPGYFYNVYINTNTQPYNRNPYSNAIKNPNYLSPIYQPPSNNNINPNVTVPKDKNISPIIHPGRK